MNFRFLRADIEEANLESHTFDRIGSLIQTAIGNIFFCGPLEVLDHQNWTLHYTVRLGYREFLLILTWRCIATLKIRWAVFYWGSIPCSMDFCPGRCTCATLSEEQGWRCGVPLAGVWDVDRSAKSLQLFCASQFLRSHHRPWPGLSRVDDGPEAFQRSVESWNLARDRLSKRSLGVPYFSNVLATTKAKRQLLSDHPLCPSSGVFNAFWFRTATSITQKSRRREWTRLIQRIDVSKLQLVSGPRFCSFIAFW